MAVTRLRFAGKALLLTVGVSSALLPAWPVDATPPPSASPSSSTPPRVELAAAVASADAVALVLVANPSTDQRREPGTGNPPFVRRRWQLQVAEVLKGARLQPNTTLLVDEAGWQADLAAHKACSRKRQATCPMPSHPVYASQLAREPRSGDTVLVLLRRDGSGWQLAFEDGFDHASQGDVARRLLAAKARP